MRINRRWNQKKKPRTVEQMANALAAAIWKLGAEVVLSLENENFETSTQIQRLDVLEEFVIFLLHMADRRIYPQTTAEIRSRFISALARDLDRLLADSRFEFEGHVEDGKRFIDKVNRRTGEYSNYQYSAVDGASIALRCTLGEHIRAQMGERDSKWVPDYIIEREAPAAERSLKIALEGLVSFGD